MNKTFFFVLFIFYTSTLANELSGKLIFSHVIFRHGDRTPIDAYPTDPWHDRKFWPTDFGQLTNIGKMQQYKLGKWLRNRYNSLLNETYSRNEIYIQATDVDRTLMSALSNLAGLYEPKGIDVWNENIQWQPIPVHTIPEYEDKVLAAKKFCAEYNNALDNLKNSDEFQKFNKKYTYLYDYLTKYTGKLINSLEGIERIYNTLYIEELYNKTLPQWTKKVYPNGDMKDIADFTFALQTYTRQLARLKVGPLIKEIFNRFKSKVKTKSKIKQSIWIYSGHDTTIGNVLNGLKLFDLHSPPYTACILIELRVNDNNKPLVSVFYKNTTETPQPLYIPGCGIQCPLDQMFNLYNDILPNDWEYECKSSTNPWLLSYNDYSTEYSSSLLLLLLGLCASIGIFMTMVYFISMYYRRRHYINYRCYVQ